MVASSAENGGGVILALRGVMTQAEGPEVGEFTGPQSVGRECEVLTVVVRRSHGARDS